MKLDRTIRIGLITSLVATAIFLYVLKPIISITSKMFFSLFSKIHASTIDKMFEESALGQANDYGFWCLQLIGTMFIGLIVGYLVMSCLEKEESYDKKTLNELNADLKKLDKKIKRIRLGAGAVVLIYICIFLFASWRANFTLRTLTSFKQHITILSPYMTETEKTEILSKWAQMKNKSDYDLIYEKLNSLATSRGLKLPKNPIY